WNYQPLNDEQRLLLARLSVFTGDWTSDAVEKVCSDSVLPSKDVPRLLASLVDRCLVQFDSNGSERYSLLNIVCAYAGCKLEEREANRSRELHLKYFVSMAEEAEPHLKGPNQRIWLGRLEQQHTNIRTALKFGLNQRKPDECNRLGTALLNFW